MSLNDYSENPEPVHSSKDSPERMLEILKDIARRSGATDAALITPLDISVEERLAGLCREPQCENYGRSKTCPPHVEGPSAFREWQKESRYAVAVKIDVPTEVLLSEERQDVMKLLHEIVSEMEQQAVSMGFTKSKSFAGGSCKNLFCRNHPNCRVTDEGGECRHPEQSRPSMSGFGINAAELMHSAGWAEDSESAASSMTWIAGLVLIA